MADLRMLVEKNLSGFLVEDAKFYAERLYYEQPSQENLCLLAQCYFRQNKIKQCYLILQGSKLPASRYLLATCCFNLGKLEEAEFALTNGQTPTVQTAPASVPGGAMGLYLLGCICRRGHRKEPAIKYFMMSLQVRKRLPLSSVMCNQWGNVSSLTIHPSPFTPPRKLSLPRPTQLDGTLWSAITELSDMGVHVNIDPLFGTTMEAAQHMLSKGPSLEGSHAAPLAPLDRSSALENRRIAESGVGVGGTPKVALSLGLSSALYHVPLATPGSVPLSAASMPYDTTHSGRYDGQYDYEFAHMDSISAPATAATAQKHAGGSGSMTGPRVALFDMSTPGLTPISHAGYGGSMSALSAINGITANALHPGSFVGPQSVDARAYDGRSFDLAKPGAFPAFHDGVSGIVPMSAGDAKGGRGSDSIRAAPDLHYLAHRDGMDGHEGGAFQGQRRVSFGPTARLSFGAAGEGAEEREEEKDENPAKVQRMQEKFGVQPSLTLGDLSPARHAGSALTGQHALTPLRPRAESPHAASVLTLLAHAYQRLAQYSCRECVALLHMLPPAHFASGWVQQMLGR